MNWDLYMLLTDVPDLLLAVIFVEFLLNSLVKLVTSLFISRRTFSLGNVRLCWLTLLVYLWSRDYDNTEPLNLSLTLVVQFLSIFLLNLVTVTLVQTFSVTTWQSCLTLVSYPVVSQFPVSKSSGGSGDCLPALGLDLPPASLSDETFKDWTRTRVSSHFKFTTSP